MPHDAAAPDASASLAGSSSKEAASRTRHAVRQASWGRAQSRRESRAASTARGRCGSASGLRRPGGGRSPRRAAAHGVTARLRHTSSTKHTVPIAEVLGRGHLAARPACARARARSPSRLTRPRQGIATRWGPGACATAPGVGPIDILVCSETWRRVRAQFGRMPANSGRCRSKIGRNRATIDEFGKIGTIPGENWPNLADFTEVEFRLVLDASGPHSAETRPTLVDVWPISVESVRFRSIPSNIGRS